MVAGMLAGRVHYLRASDMSTPTTSSPTVDNDITRRDQLVLEHLPLVRAIAVRVYENLPMHVDLDDLIHAGILGLFDAANKFDDTKQVVFRGYAKHRIKGAILDSLRELDWASRDLRRRHKQLEEVTRELAAVMERNPTEVEIAERMGMGLDKWRQSAIDLRMVGFTSASTRSVDQEKAPAPEFPGCARRRPGGDRRTAPTAIGVGRRYERTAGSIPAGNPLLLHRWQDDAGDRRIHGR